MSESDTRADRKAWRQRNSDGRNAFERELRTQLPPAFTYESRDIPEVMLPAESYAEPSEESEDPQAVRHVHVYDPTLTDPDE